MLAPVRLPAAIMLAPSMLPKAVIVSLVIEVETTTLLALMLPAVLVNTAHYPQRGIVDIQNTILGGLLTIGWV